MAQARSDRWLGTAYVAVLLVSAALGVYVYQTPLRWRIVLEDGVIETLSVLAYVGAVACCVAALWRSSQDPLGATWWPVLLALCLFCAYRELSPEPESLRLHAFSWKYVLNRDYDLGVRALMLISSAGLIAAVAAHVIRRRDRLVEVMRRDGLRLPEVLILAGLALLAVAQLWDKLPATGQFDPPEYAEEWFEAIGALAILLGVADRYRRWRRDRLGPARPNAWAAAAVLLVVFAFGMSCMRAVQWFRNPIAGVTVVDPGRLITCGQARPPDLDRARQLYAFRMVVDVRCDPHDRGRQRELNWCCANGVPLARLAGRAQAGTVFLDLARDPGNHPLLLHDRTGYGAAMRYAALYLVVVKERTPEQASREVTEISGRHPDSDLLDWLRRQRAQYRAHLAGRPPATPATAPTTRQSHP